MLSDHGEKISLTLKCVESRFIFGFDIPIFWSKCSFGELEFFGHCLSPIVIEFSLQSGGLFCMFVI